MISKNRIKFIRSLHRKKQRYNNRLFIVEGVKLVEELLTEKIKLDSIYCTKNQIRIFSINQTKLSELSDREMMELSGLTTPPGVLAVVPFLDWPEPDFTSGKYLVLDRIRDPGNLGTIIRIADWFGLSGLICDLESVDCYNTKTVQASMGSLFRVPVFYRNLEDFIPSFKSKTAIIAADIRGIDIKEGLISENGLILLGSESQGLRSELIASADHCISIPRFGRAESLNVAVAAGILSFLFRVK